jgi:hypothetical protein
VRLVMKGEVPRVWRVPWKLFGAAACYARTPWFEAGRVLNQFGKNNAAIAKAGNQLLRSIRKTACGASGSC